MPLTNAIPTGFIPTANPETARAFYEATLGLRFVADEPFAMVFRRGPEPGSDLRIVRVGAKHQAIDFINFGWEVGSIEQAVEELVAKGVQFLRYPGTEQNERGIWHAPGCAKLCGSSTRMENTLSIAEHSA